MNGNRKNQWQHWQHFVHLFHVVKLHILSIEFHSVAEIHHGAILSSDLKDIQLYCQPFKLVQASHQLASNSGLLTLFFHLAVELNVFEVITSDIHQFSMMSLMRNSKKLQEVVWIFLSSS
jgi:hypothetical protein